MAPAQWKSPTAAVQVGGQRLSGGGQGTKLGVWHLMTGSFWNWSVVQLVLTQLMGQPTTAMCTGMTDGGRSPTCKHTSPLSLFVAGSFPLCKASPRSWRSPEALPAV